MKKALVLGAAIAMIVAPVFATEFSVSGDVSATFGINFPDDDSDLASGFVNDTDLEVIIPFIAADTSTSNEGEGVWGEISVEDLGLQISNGVFDTAFDDDEDDSFTGTISGKVHFGSFFLGVFNTPDVDVNYAENFAIDYDATAYTGANYMDFNSDTALFSTTGGMSFGFDNDVHSVELSVSSVGDYGADEVSGEAAVTGSQFWTGRSATTAVAGDYNTDNQYVVALDSSFDFDVFTADAYFMFANKVYTDSAYIGFGLKPGIELDFNDSMGIELSVGTDALVVPEAFGATYNGLYMDIAPEFIFNLAAANADDDRTNLTIGAYMAIETADAFSANNMQLNFTATFTEESDGGFVDGLGAEVSFDLSDLLDYADAGSDYLGWDLDASVDYEVIDGLTPSLGAGYGSNEKLSFEAGLELGDDLTGITNTTFNLDYSSDNLSGGADTGVLTLMTTISF
jgi:hypothetical protein